MPPKVTRYVMLCSPRHIAILNTDRHHHSSILLIDNTYEEIIETVRSDTCSLNFTHRNTDRVIDSLAEKNWTQCLPIWISIVHFQPFMTNFGIYCVRTSLLDDQIDVSRLSSLGGTLNYEEAFPGEERHRTSWKRIFGCHIRPAKAELWKRNPVSRDLSNPENLRNRTVLSGELQHLLKKKPKGSFRPFFKIPLHHHSRAHILRRPSSRKYGHHCVSYWANCQKNQASPADATEPGGTVGSSWHAQEWTPARTADTAGLCFPVSGLRRAQVVVYRQQETRQRRVKLPAAATALESKYWRNHLVPRGKRSGSSSASQTEKRQQFVPPGQSIFYGDTTSRKLIPKRHPARQCRASPSDTGRTPSALEVLHQQQSNNNYSSRMARRANAMVAGTRQPVEPCMVPQEGASRK
ncbi:uncharacterized protein LOC129759545 [Uranotaenia lowii]|uniref:uncharacterized protein LOC129759545 n=1 Tax=Uranotaenia lowii TaxID=190385 RepID=UPI00247A28FB|nr:uncharacterized protein LOC129759545 [Uranotaenia lowii]